MTRSGSSPSTTVIRAASPAATRAPILSGFTVFLLSLAVTVVAIIIITYVGLTTPSVVP